jgi:hypothetical protein
VRLRSLIVVVVGAGCADATSRPLASDPHDVPTALSAPAPEASVPRAATPSSRWPLATRSPWPVPSTSDPREVALSSACGTADGAIARVATLLAEERARGLGAPDPDRITALLRAQGEPHVRPRLVSASSRAPLDDEALRARLESLKHTGARCGVAFARAEPEREVFTAILVDAPADLEALPTRARTGQWLTFAATVHAPVTGAKLVVLGPRGLPRTVPTAIDRASGQVRARFALDQPGAFTVQLVGDLASGPAPLLEARVFADLEPNGDDAATPAPGETAATEGDDVLALARMTAALRASESLPPLARSEPLDALARAHAEKMRDAGAIAHDLGDGDLALRFEAAGLAAKVVGENVARARSITAAHRALHASPSHRMNLLHAEYTHLGLGVATDAAGTVYACEVFAALR